MVKFNYIVLGIALLLLAKYVIFGLRAWDGFFHPGRIEPSDLDQFQAPLLGIFGGVSQ